MDKYKTLAANTALISIGTQPCAEMFSAQGFLLFLREAVSCC